MRTRQSYRQEKKRQTVKKVVLWSLFTVVMLLAVFVVKVWFDLKNTERNVYQDVSTSQLRTTEVNLTDQKPISILLIGTDTPLYTDPSSAEPARSDTLIVVTINPKEKTTTMVSIPRDSYTPIIGYPGRGEPNVIEKITHAYAYGEEAMTINTVQQFLQLPIDYYVRVNMQGLNDLVNAVNGIEVTSPLTFSFSEGAVYSNIQFREGETRKVNGVEALAFARMRDQDPDGDIGRQVRQRIVVEALVKKLLSLDGVANYQQILESISKNVKTNLTLDDMMFIGQHYREALTTVNQETLQMYPFELNGVSLMYVPDKERLRVSNVLREQLQIETVKLNQFYDPIADENLLYLVPEYDPDSDTTENSDR